MRSKPPGPVTAAATYTPIYALRWKAPHLCIKRLHIVHTERKYTEIRDELHTSSYPHFTAKK